MFSKSQSNFIKFFLNRRTVNYTPIIKSKNATNIEIILFHFLLLIYRKIYLILRLKFYGLIFEHQFHLNSKS